MDDFLLFLGKAIGVFRVYGREVRVVQFIFLSFIDQDALLEIDASQQIAVVHVEFRMAAGHGCLQLELDDADGLVHLRNQAACTFVVRLVPLFDFGKETLARIVGIGVHGKGCQGEEIDAVAVFQRDEVGVTQGRAQYVGNAAFVAGGSAHPENVMVAPLDVKVVIVAERIHDEMGTGTTVVDVADEMQRVDDQALDEVAQGDDELVRAVRLDDGADDDVEILVFVRFVGGFVEKFLDDVGELRRQRLLHFRAGIFR